VDISRKACTRINASHCRYSTLCSNPGRSPFPPPLLS
jgi:hypothetical protein